MSAEDVALKSIATIVNALDDIGMCDLAKYTKRLAVRLRSDSDSLRLLLCILIEVLPYLVSAKNDEGS